MQREAEKKEPVFFYVHLFYYLAETGEFFRYARPEENRSKLQFRVFNFGMR